MKRILVVEEIQNRIVEGKLRLGAKLPSERTLAEELGASRTAVQAALKELEQLGIVSRQANCRPVIVGKGPVETQMSTKARQVADQIAVWMLPETQDLGGAMLLQGIRSAFSEQNFSLLISSPPSYDEESIRRAEIQFLRAAKDDPRVAGVITWDTGNPECRAAYQALIEAQVPLVFVDRKPDIPIAADVVMANHRKAARQAVRYLLELGHQSIAMVLGNDRASSVSDRVEGYEAALKDFGLDYSSCVIHLDTTENVIADNADAILDRLLGEGQTAVFAVNDRVAYHLLEAAKRKGVSIPDQLSIVGFDWLARWMPSGGELTTLAQPFDEIGRTASHRILDRIFRPTATPREILLDAELVVRESTTKPNI